MTSWVVKNESNRTGISNILVGETFEEALANEGIELRRREAERLGQAVVRALGGIHKLLNAEQRERLAYLIRTGSLMI
jgi:hypothetical protein